MTNETQVAFPVLTAAQIAALRPYGEVRPMRAGELLWSEGDRGFGLFVVLSGEVEILDRSGGESRRVTLHTTGEFTGDVDVLTGRASLVSAVATAPGEVLALPADAVQRVIEELPGISDLLLRAFLLRRSLLLEGGFQGLRIIGSRFSPEAHHLREFASRNAIPYTWLDLDADPQAEALLRRFGISPEQTPIVFGREGGWVSNPTVAQMAHYMGLDVDLSASESYDLVVVGAGPAGLAGSVYGASEGLRTLTLDQLAAGGQAGTSSRIENYLGFPTGISGGDLAANALLQAQKFGARITVPRRAAALRADCGDRIVTLDDGTELRARCVLIATGAEYRRLDVPRIREMEGAGIYYAATEMEARFCRGEETVVVGGGNSAGQAAVFLAGSAERVHVVIRGEDLGKSMSRYLVDRVERTPNIEVHRCTEVAAVEGETHLSAVRLRGPGGETRIWTRALFVFIGAIPQTDWLAGGADSVLLDRGGFVVTGDGLPAEFRANARWRYAGRSPFFLETSLPGVFAAGDVRSSSVKRVASAVGEGSMAISFVHAHLGATG